MGVMIAAGIVFLVGALTAIVAPPVGVALLIGGGIVLVVSSCVYLAMDYKQHTQHSISSNNPSSVPLFPSQNTPEPLPQQPVYITPDSGFVYPDMLRQLPAAYQQRLKAGSTDFFVNVRYHGQMVMQFINCPDPDKGITQDIGIFFYPETYDNNTLMRRFKNNAFIHCFSTPFYQDEVADAYFGSDLQKAMQVASYILATVYYIPTTAHLDIHLETN